MRRFGVRRGAFRGRGRSGNRPRWTAVVLADTTAPAAQDDIALVAPADYATATSLEDAATLVRIRGNLQIYNTSATLASTVNIAIYAHTATQVINPSIQSTLQEGNILWAKGIILQPTTAGGGGAPFAFHDIDIRSKRRLEMPQTTIWLTIANAVGGGTIAWGGIFRSLLRLKA